MKFEITPMQAEDWPAVEAIYHEGIASGNATFEIESPGWERWNANHHTHSRLVARTESEIVGWAALSRLSPRQVYAGVAEVSIYVASGAGERVSATHFCKLSSNRPTAMALGLYRPAFSPRTRSASLYTIHAVSGKSAGSKRSRTSPADGETSFSLNAAVRLQECETGLNLQPQRLVRLRASQPLTRAFATVSLGGIQ